MESINPLSLILVGLIVMLLYVSKGFYNYFVYLVFALLMVAFVGYDPVTMLIPPVFAIGILSGHIRLKKLRFPILMQIFNIVFIAFAAISCFWEPVWNWVIRFISGVIFFYFLNLFLTSKEKMKNIFFFIIVGTLLSSFAALLALLEIWSPGPMFFPVFQSFRFAGLYNTTMLGIFTTILIFWVCDETLKPKLWINALLIKVLVLVSLLVQLLATLTRSAWLGLSLGMFTYLFVEIYRSTLKKRIIVIAGFVLVSATVLYLIVNLETADLIRLRIQQDSIYASEGEEKRAEFYFTKNALKLAMEHPFGVGIGNTQKNVDDFNGLEVGAHNNFVMVMSDMGWITFFSFLFLQIYILRILFNNAIRSRQKYGLSAQMLLSSYVALLASGMYQDLILYIPMWLVPSLSTVVIFGRSLEVDDIKGTVPTLPKSGSSRTVECTSG